MRVPDRRTSGQLIDKVAHTVTIKGPQGRTENIKAKDPKNLDAIKVVT